MNFFTLLSVEFQKIRRSRITWILLLATVILWLPSILNVHLNFEMQSEGISPENNFLIQGFMGMAWFMFPASIIVSTVLLIQTERGSRGMTRMLTMPVSTARLCLAKFILLLCLSALQILMTVGIYFLSAFLVTQTQDYNFILPPAFVFTEAAKLYLAAIPSMAFFWMLAVCIQTPIFSMGIGLASIVPSVLMINTKIWFVYPMAYPFFVITAEYGRLAEHIDTVQIQWIPWLPVALGITLFCLVIACFRFGQAERK